MSILNNESIEMLINELQKVLVTSKELDTLDLRVGWAMQSRFRVLGINTITSVAERITTKPAQCRFDELEDGEHFILAMTLAFGSARVMQRVAESDKYNAVWMENTNRSELIPADIQVVRVRDETDSDSPAFIFKPL